MACISGKHFSVCVSVCVCVYVCVCVFFEWCCPCLVVDGGGRLVQPARNQLGLCSQGLETCKCWSLGQHLADKGVSALYCWTSVHGWLGLLAGSAQVLFSTQLGNAIAAKLLERPDVVVEGDACGGHGCGSNKF